MEFFQLGFDPVLEISAEHGTGVAELLDEIVTRLDPKGAKPSASGLKPQDSSAERTRRAVRARQPQSRDLDPRHASRSSAGRTSASRRSSTGCCARSACWSATCRGRRATPSTCRCCGTGAASASSTRPGMRRPGRVAGGGKVEMVSVALAKESIADADVVALVIDASTGAAGSGRRDWRRSRSRRPRRRHRRQQVGPREDRRTRTSSRSSTTSCATACGSSTTRRSCTSRR